MRLGPEWALQDPDDYLRTFQSAIPAAIAAAGIDPAAVVGVGIDFTACTMLPTKADGTPLCDVPELRAEPHAWVKLWKHHAAQPEADRINAVARERGEPWIDTYGGRISSEWFYSKALQILDEAPHVYAAADRLIEAADWVVWRLTGVETRNCCTAGYKAIWSKQDGFPGRDYFAALDPRFADVVDHKMSRTIVPIGARAGGLSEEAAAWTGLRPGTAVAVANVDAHVSVPAATVTEPGRMVMVMGTSICHMVLGDHQAVVEGMCGVVEDGILPGLFGYEAGSRRWATSSPGSSTTSCRRRITKPRPATASTSMPSSSGRPRAGARPVRSAWPSTGGTAIARSSSMSTSPACSSGPPWRRRRRRSIERSSRPRPSARA